MALSLYKSKRHKKTWPFLGDYDITVTRNFNLNDEAPNTANSFSLEVLYDIADALEVTPADLINASLFSDNVINKKHD